jgi:hypothetical protein
MSRLPPRAKSAGGNRFLRRLDTCYPAAFRRRSATILLPKNSFLKSAVFSKEFLKFVHFWEVKSHYLLVDSELQKASFPVFGVIFITRRNNALVAGLP